MSLDGLGLPPLQLTAQPAVSAAAAVEPVQQVGDPSLVQAADAGPRTERRKYEPAKTRPQSIRRVRVENIEHLSAIRTSLGSCQYLTIAPGNELEEAHFALLATFPYLIDLQMAGCGGVRLEMLQLLRPLAPGLRTLNVSNCGLPEGARDELARYFPNCVIRDGA